MTTPMPMSTPTPMPAPGGHRIEAVPFGDSALMLSVRSADANVRRAAAGRLRAALLPRLPYGVRDVVAGLESLLVEYDPLAVGYRQLEEVLRLIIAVHGGDGDSGAGAAHFVIPTVFGGAYAPDLADVAAELGVSTQEVIGRISSSVLTVSLLAAAMAPMMDGVDFPSPVSRCVLPRTDVAPGSVMVAGKNAIIQPFPGPSGWKIIGRTPLTICDIRRSPATSYKPGDTVRFEPLSEQEWSRLEGRFLQPVETEDR